MNISKFDLYKTEWLDLVFAKRNKAYGAYELRQHSAENTTKAMLITFTTVISALLALSFVVRAKPAEVVKITTFENKNKVYVEPAKPPKKEEVHHEKAAPPKQPVNTVQNLPPVVVPQTPPIEPPKIKDFDKAEVGPETITIPDGDGSGKVSVNDGNGGGGTAAIAEDNSIHTEGVNIDVEPEPYGGAAAWNKFLQKNLKYPPMAIDANISGRVFITFIVEKNGHISSYEVLRGPGYGMNEEALRVLKMAPPWKPGMQHGQPVRVKYTLPFNFTIND